jgi:hypothetical protein
VRTSAARPSRTRSRFQDFEVQWRRFHLQTFSLEGRSPSGRTQLPQSVWKAVKGEGDASERAGVVLLHRSGPEEDPDDVGGEIERGGQQSGSEGLQARSGGCCVVVGGVALELATRVADHGWHTVHYPQNQSIGALGSIEIVRSINALDHCVPKRKRT